MDEVLLTRGGFSDEAAIMRLHRAARLSVHVSDHSLGELAASGFFPRSRDVPACVAFGCPLRRGCLGAQDLEELRIVRAACPLLVLIAFVEREQLGRSAQTSATVELLDAGADDVVTLGIEPVEYAARVRALVRRQRWNLERIGQQPLPPGERPRLDLERRRLLGSLGVEALTAKECIVMQVVLESDGVATRSLIGERLWTDGWYGTKKAIDMHVANLRRKLVRVCGDEWVIETVRGRGFVLVPAAAGTGVGA